AGADRTRDAGAAAYGGAWALVPGERGRGDLAPAGQPASPDAAAARRPQADAGSWPRQRRDSRFLAPSCRFALSPRESLRMHTRLFSPFSLRGLPLANRIVVSPMAQYSAEDGCATQWNLVHLGTLSVSGAGLLISVAP